MQHTEPRRIIKNLELVFSTGDIGNLKPVAYEFLYLLSGFIAHYDINGFKHYYSSTDKLRSDILSSSDISNKNRYITDSFFCTGKNKDYYADKYRTLAELEQLLQGAKV